MTDRQLPEGVSWHPGIRAWRADYMNRYIGSRFTISEAAELYRSFAAAHAGKPEPTPEETVNPYD